MSQRKPHAVLDRASRVQKARKIINLVGHVRFEQANAMLEIGCGSGVIASTMAALRPTDLSVSAVDVADNRVEKDGYTFSLVQGTELPFQDDHFDIVISNHVIEHVGNQSDQIHHLNEISRVLRPSGVAYLAVPNKWRFWEPHYRLPFLSWLPQGFANSYLKLTGRGEEYDCRPLSSIEARKIFRASGLVAENITALAFHETLATEHSGSALARTVSRITPDLLLSASMPIIPTLVYLLSRESQ